MSLPSRKVKNALIRKGFEETKDARHLRYRYRDLNGKISGIRTHMSHGGKPKDLNAYLIGQMAKQCGLSTKDFQRFVHCDMEQEEYDQKAKEHAQTRYRRFRR